MGFAIMRIEKIKSVVAGNARLRHNRRETKCVTSNPGRKNICLIFSEQMRKDRNKSFRHIFHERTRGQKPRKNAVMALEVVLTFSPGAVPEEQLKDWAQDNATWLRKTFGNDNIIDCQLHRDEKNFHLQTILIPIDEKGRLNARAFVGGTRQRMSELQTDYANSMAKYGLKRGICREITKARHESSLRWHERQAQKETRLQAYEKVFGVEETWDFDKFLEFQKTKAEIDKKEKATERLPMEASK
ncbi:MAG: plasmid recombination protein [Clostridia bacterium]|nr:plasmid recombination protein [Clostridia bacterium]